MDDLKPLRLAPLCKESWLLLLLLGLLPWSSTGLHSTARSGGRETYLNHGRRDGRQTSEELIVIQLGELEGV